MRLAPVESETENAPKQQQSPCAPSRCSSIPRVTIAGSSTKICIRDSGRKSRLSQARRGSTDPTPYQRCRCRSTTKSPEDCPAFVGTNGHDTTVLLASRQRVKSIFVIDDRQVVTGTFSLLSVADHQIEDAVGEV